MSGAAITNPVYILTSAFHAALAPAVALVEGVPAVFWLQASQAATDALLSGAIPGLIVFQAQTPQAFSGYINGAEASGTIVVRALARTDDGAQTLLAAAIAALAAPLTAPAGTAVQAEWLSEIIIPPVGGVHTGAASYRVTVGYD